MSTEERDDERGKVRDASIREASETDDVEGHHSKVREAAESDEDVEGHLSSVREHSKVRDHSKVRGAMDDEPGTRDKTR